jgi:Putative peptidoglycan binding domain
MRKVIYLGLIAAFLALDWSAAAATHTKKKATHSTRKRSTKGSSASRKKTTSKRTATTWRNRQMTPTPERYKEIQDALVSRGFLSGEDANGTWGASSSEALKRFQAEQNIEANGKINSLSLIALGLGPKRESASAQPLQPADPKQEPSQR